MSFAAVSIERIKAAAAAEFGVPLRMLDSDRRHKPIVRARQVAMYLACNLSPLSTVAIGRAFGKRDHTTVLHALRRIATARDSDRALDQRILRIEQDLEPPIPLQEEIQLAFLTGPLFDWLHDPTRPQATLRQLEAA